jgi:diguanylate cyclase (GGDEF)-like protein
MTPSSNGKPTSKRAARPVREFLARRADPYAGGDAGISRRLSAAVWLLSAVVTLALLPIAPPTESLGRLGWPLAGAVILGFVAVGYELMTERGKVSFNELLAKSYLGVALIVLLEWLAGGRGSPYHGLFLLWAVYTATVHPPRRLAPFLLVVTAAASAPLFYDGGGQVAAADTAVELLLWFAMALAANLWTMDVRARQLGLQREGAHANQLAREDTLTELGNRRAFDETLAAEIARTDRTGRPFSVLVADLDDFKAINDQYGHLNGDDCLRQVAGTLEGAVRAIDTCFRWGGDEFAVVLPETDHKGAERLCQRIRGAIAATCTRPDGSPVTLTCGSAEFAPGMTADDLVDRADMALIGVKMGSPAARL